LNVRALHFCDVTVDGESWPVFGWAIDAPAGTILVDTGMVDSTPALDAEWGPVVHPWPLAELPVAVINTHLHFDHCGGNRRLAGTPPFVQRPGSSAPTTSGPPCSTRSPAVVTTASHRTA